MGLQFLLKLYQTGEITPEERADFLGTSRTAVDNMARFIAEFNGATSR